MICNASPDLHRQISANSILQPRVGARHTPIAAVLLVDGQIDHSIGLLLLRENSTPLDVWTTLPVHEDLTSGLPILSVLEHYCGIQWHPLALDVTLQIPSLANIEVKVIPVNGKPGPYSRYRNAPRQGDNVAVTFRDMRTGRQAFYAPGLAAVTPGIRGLMQESQCVLVDGTFWSEDEMIEAGVSSKRASELGHLPQSGVGGMLAVLEDLSADTRRILIHINNTNPILNDDSSERATLDAAGVEVALDGMEIQL